MSAKRKKQSLEIGNGLIAALAVVALTIIVFGMFSKGIWNLPDLDDLDIDGWAQSDSENKDDEQPVIGSDGKAYVHFIDVGQGDSELIIADDGTAMLIDAGERETGQTVVNYLKNLGITTLDYIVATHPHSDHMGGLATVINSDIEVKNVIMPVIPEEYTPTTKTYERFLDAIENKGCELHSLKDEAFDFGSGRITMIKPDYSDSNLNNYSAVVRYDFGENSFLFTGDIESNVESELVKRGVDLDVDVLKVPHHGSSTSSSKKFLVSVDPEYCIIECGDDNSYNHPHKETVEKLSEYTDRIYRTDYQGSIVFICTPDSMKVVTEK